MKAIVQDTYGSTDVLELRDIDRPEIADPTRCWSGSAPPAWTAASGT